MPYSFVGIQTLVINNCYPSVYWETACLIVNSGGNDAFDDVEEKDESSDEEEIEVGKKKKKVRNTDYGRIAKALGSIIKEGVTIAPPSVNYSDFTFKPDAKNDRILYGLKGINGISTDCAAAIIKNRPYTSIEDVLEKCKLKKPQVVNLIKAGAFDEFGDRQRAMTSYIDSISDKKKTLNLRNVQMLIRYEMIPSDYSFEVKVFNFNKYLKATNKGRKEDYVLDGNSYPFYEQNFDVDLLSNVNGRWVVGAKDWKKIYDSYMAHIKVFISNNKDELLKELNDKLFKETWSKYALGNISKWEMDSVSFYSHEHELKKVKNAVYNISDFSRLKNEPEVDKIITIKGKDVKLFKIRRIAGTVIDKNKNKNTVTLLTSSGVVDVKLYGEAYAKYDRQISETGADGKKHVVEKGWFTRGTLLIVSGIKRGPNSFFAKKYARTPYHLVEKIERVKDDGFIVTRAERAGEEPE